MTGDCHVRFCEGLEGKFRWPTLHSPEQRKAFRKWLEVLPFGLQDLEELKENPTLEKRQASTGKGLVHFAAAATSGRKNKLAFLADYGADLNATIKISLMKFLSAHDADLNATISISPLFAHGIDAGAFIRLKEQEIDTGYTPLIIATELNDLDAVKFLISQRVDLDIAIASTGETALHIAARKRYSRIVEKLLQAGAGVNLVTKMGETTLYILSRAGLVDLAIKMMKNQKADPRIQTKNLEYPVTAAASLGEEKQDEAVKILRYYIKNRKLPFDSLALDGTSPLFVAARYAGPKVVRYFLELKSDPNIIVDTLPNRGQGPLHQAVLADKPGNLKLLIGYGGKPSLFTKAGLDVLQFAAENRKLNALSFLIYYSGLEDFSRKTGNIRNDTVESIIKRIIDQRKGSSNTLLKIQAALESRIKRLEAVKYPTTNISEEEIILGPTIGSGSFGEVQSGYLRGMEVAVKRVKESGEKSEDLSQNLGKRIKKEFILMMKLNHPAIVKTVGFVKRGQGRGFYLVTKYETGGTLLDLIRRAEKLSDFWKTKLFQEICSAVAYLHDKPRKKNQVYIHGDLKPGNIFIRVLTMNDGTQGYQAVVGDFGASRIVKYCKGQGVNGKTVFKIENGCGTHGYLAPEMLLPRGSYRETTDTFALGMVGAAIENGEEPYTDYNEQQKNNLMEYFRLHKVWTLPKLVYGKSRKETSEIIRALWGQKLEGNKSQIKVSQEQANTRMKARDAASQLLVLCKKYGEYSNLQKAIKGTFEKKTRTCTTSYDRRRVSIKEKNSTPSNINDNKSRENLTEFNFQ